jgi:hypothetical protein
MKEAITLIMEPSYGRVALTSALSCLLEIDEILLIKGILRPDRTSLL